MSEKVKIKVDRDIMRMPTIALRGLVVFPNNVVHFEVGREKSVAAVEWAMNNSSHIFLITQREMETETPTVEDLYEYGVVAEVKQVLRVSDEVVKVLVEGKYRARLLALESGGKFLISTIKPAPLRGVRVGSTIQMEAMLRSLKEAFERYLSLNPRLSKDVVYNILSSDDAAFLAEYVPANILLKYQDKQQVLNESTLMRRISTLLELLNRECQVLSIEKEIQDKVSDQMDKNQRDYYLREQMRVIATELDETEDARLEAEEYRKKIEALELPEEAGEKLLKETERMARMQGNSQEAAVIRT